MSMLNPEEVTDSNLYRLLENENGHENISSIVRPRLQLFGVCAISGHATYPQTYTAGTAEVSLRPR